MTSPDLRHIRNLVLQYRLALAAAAVTVAFASLAGRHLNTGTEAAQSLDRIYGAAPHVELCVKPATYPTR